MNLKVRLKALRQLETLYTPIGSALGFLAVFRINLLLFYVSKAFFSISQNPFNEFSLSEPFNSHAFSQGLKSREPEGQPWGAWS